MCSDSSTSPLNRGTLFEPHYPMYNNLSSSLLYVQFFILTALYTVLFHPHHSVYNDSSSSQWMSDTHTDSSPSPFYVQHYFTLTILCSIISPSQLYVQHYFTLITLCTALFHTHHYVQQYFTITTVTLCNVISLAILHTMIQCYFTLTTLLFTYSVIHPHHKLAQH